MLYRKIAKLIEAHLSSDSGRMLLIDGARQIGQSYIVRWVGQKMFPNYIEVNTMPCTPWTLLNMNMKESITRN